jgi:transcriptional regulator with XRE-family HTH domain
MPSIADKVKAYRQLLRLSQAYVGQTVLGLDRTTYTRMENGRIEFSADDLRRLSNVFRVTAGDFLTLNGGAEDGEGARRRGRDAFLPSAALPLRDETAFSSVTNAATDLVLFARDKAARRYVQARQRSAAKARGRFSDPAAALRHCLKLRQRHLAGPSLLIERFIIEEFGLWLSWNPLGPYASVHIPQGTAISPQQTLPLPLIVVHSEHSFERQRLSAAHALGHHLMGGAEVLGCGAGASASPAEAAADEFAQGLLMTADEALPLYAAYRAPAKGAAPSAPLAALLAARHLQVPYPALVARLTALGAIGREDRPAFAKFKLRDQRKKLQGQGMTEPFKDAYVGLDEAHLAQAGHYQTDPHCGGPRGPQDLRYLQESSYVEYLRSCRSKAPEELAVVFEHVAEYVRKKYPRYL